MKFVIVGRNGFNVTDHLKEAIEEKLGKLDRFFSKETQVHVTLSVE
ncbi:MAG: HPF/RaiA family ribosome-associated protein, partial [Lachnospiraceae bacterium]|nr:HPF/RaiA family ribosome-associated protein [Lachnospiraceae bacterium]